MTTLAVLFLTPFFGFTLTPPAGVAPAPAPNSLLRVPVFAQVSGDDDEASEDAPAAENEAEPEAEEDDDDSSAGGTTDMAAYAAQLRQRSEIGAVHRAFGIATWGAMLVTSVLGFIQYYNLYGFGSREDTPCVTGGAVFGQDQCWGIPWPHRIGWITTTALYSATFIMSFIMPDPDNASEGSSAYAQNLSLHKTLRWVHLAGMVLQVFLGLATAQNWFGIDRANDFDAQRALATVHQVIGWGTLGVMTAAGAIMIF